MTSGFVSSLHDALVVCSWNVRGLTDLKMFELILHMKRYDIDILCIQETHKNTVAAYEEQGHLVLLSGNGTDSRSWAGVGIIVAPRCKYWIKSYKQISDRLCSLSLKVRGGILGIVSAYAPHNLKPLDERLHFFTELDYHFRRCSANIGKLVFGDLNSRVGGQLPGEDHIVGPHTFGRRAVHKVEVPNRDLLLEACEGNSLLIANTFFQGFPEDKATYMEPGSTFLGTVTETAYNMLDLLLCDSVSLDKCSGIGSIRTAALATDHYLVKAVFQFDAPRAAEKPRRNQNASALQDSDVRVAFAKSFCSMVEPPSLESTLSNLWDAGKASMLSASEALPPQRRTANQPWISQGTLELIDRRRRARAQNEYRNEQELHKEVRKAAKADRSRWLDKLLEDGDWQQIRKLRKPRGMRGGRLRNIDGEIVESTEWPDTMADHLEHIQWHVRPAGAVEGPSLGAELPVSVAFFTEIEVKTAILKLKGKRASGPDDIPAEFWQAVAETNEGISWITELCNKCWNNEEIPGEWHMADVTAIHKKGSVEDCDNCRPISLICVAYKLFASLLLKRLQAGGAEARLTKTQFGFRRKVGTADAIFAVRRHIDLALAQRRGMTSLLALDWKKAFDSINVDSLIIALRRFGLPPKVLNLIEHIYADRFFTVRDGGNASSKRRQRSGISQGCPLSPFLFVMLMTVVMHDAVHCMSDGAQAAFNSGSLGVVLYADDTLLIGVSEGRVQEFLDTVAVVGKRYGMELHSSKFQLLSVNGDYQLRTPEGHAIPNTDSMTYLGATVYADGSLKRELGRKLGCAWADFTKLNRLWKHSTLTKSRKIAVYQAVIISRLLYGLGSAWLNVADIRRLNGFHCRCLRVILRIQPAYFSRVSNKRILEQSGQRPLDRQLLKHQMLLYGRVARSPATDPLRNLTFVPGGLEPATSRYIRRVGRPRNEWANMVNKECFKMDACFANFIDNEMAWKTAVSTYTSRPCI
jgi:hypothetical protein